MATATGAMTLAGAVNAVVDRGVRATRIAARADVTELARQLARTEDKLERLLQEVEELSAKLDAGPAPAPIPVARRAAPLNGSAARTPR